MGNRILMGLATKIILLFVLFLNGCAVVVNNNWGSNIHTTKTVDDIGLKQEYDVTVKKGIR